MLYCRDSHPIHRLLLIALVWLLTCGAADFPINFDEFVIEEKAADKELFTAPPKSLDYEIPRVAERAYAVEEPERLPVESIVVRNVIPHPDRGITQEEVQKVLDRAFEAQRDFALDEYGFTQGDYKEIGRKLRDVLDRGGQPDIEDMNELFKLIDERKNEQGYITVEQLESIAQEITNYYRSQGLILATAYIPAQEVKDGIVYLDVLEGTLGEVTVSSNQVYAEDTIAQAFQPELGKTVTEESIEGALRRINDLPGVRVRGSFSPGKHTGETSLNLGVLDESSWVSTLLMDNHGSETTGEARAYAATQWLNIAGRGHRLMLGALRSEGPDSSLYGILEYELPVTRNGRGRVKAGVSSNEFSVAGFANLPEIIGETVNYSVQGNYQVVRSRTLNLGWELGYTVKDVLFRVGQLTTLSTDQTIETYSGSVNYTQLWDQKLLLANGQIGLDVGHMVSGEARGQSTDFQKILFSANLLKRFEIFNWLTKGRSPVNFVIKLNGQYSEYFLSAVEQFSLGGPNAVRSFSVSDVSVDSGAYAGVELFFNLPPVEKLLPFPVDPFKPFLFFDYAYGVARATELSGNPDMDSELKGYGLGLRISWKDRGVINMIFARPWSEHFENTAVDVRGKERFYIDFTYQFH